jgi:hypothetical protein
MTGKGSKTRPLSVSQNEFDKQWDLIFGGKGMKYNEHKTTVKINEEIGKHWSDNGRKEAIIKKSELGFSVELYEQSRYIRTVECFDKSLNYAEDVAENFCLGLLS